MYYIYMSETKSKPVYRFESQHAYVINNVKFFTKQSIIDGPKGLYFKYTKKEGDNYYKITAKEITKDNFNVKEKKEGAETSSDINMTELKKILKSNKDLEFVNDYVLKERTKYKGGSIKKSSRKSSRKSSKKTSRTNTKVLKGGSRKINKKNSKN